MLSATTALQAIPTPDPRGDLSQRVVAFLSDLQRFEVETRPHRPLSRRGLRAPLRIADYERWTAEQVADGKQVVPWSEARLQLGYWKHALDLAELRRSPGQRDGLLSYEDLQRHLRACALDCELQPGTSSRRLSTSDYARYYRCTPDAPSLDAVKRWYGTWANACLSIGLTSGCVRIVDDVLLGDAMRRMAATLGRAPSVKEYDRLRPAGSQSASALIRQRGSWLNVVCSVGLQPSYQCPLALVA